MTFALVKNGVVLNIIIADEEFINAITPQYDYIVQIDAVDPQPTRDWTYDGVSFTAP